MHKEMLTLRRGIIFLTVVPTILDIKAKEKNCNQYRIWHDEEEGSDKKFLS